jgi:hypothetical protein
MLLTLRQTTALDSCMGMIGTFSTAALHHHNLDAQCRPRRREATGLERCRRLVAGAFHRLRASSTRCYASPGQRRSTAATVPTLRGPALRRSSPGGVRRRRRAVWEAARPGLRAGRPSSGSPSTADIYTYSNRVPNRPVDPGGTAVSSSAAAKARWTAAAWGPPSLGAAAARQPAGRQADQETVPARQSPVTQHTTVSSTGYTPGRPHPALRRSGLPAVAQPTGGRAGASSGSNRAVGHIPR